MIPGKDEIIFPITHATCRIVERPRARRVPQASSGVSVMVMATESIMKPSRTRCWETINTDLSGWIVNPKESN